MGGHGHKEKEDIGHDHGHGHAKEENKGHEHGHGHAKEEKKGHDHGHGHAKEEKKGHDHGHDHDGKGESHDHSKEKSMPVWKKRALESAADPNAAPFGGDWNTESSTSATADKMEQ